MNSETMVKERERRGLLATWAETLDKAAARGVIGGKSVTIRQATIVNGPRAGALELHAGFESGALLRALQADDGATLRQMIPFDFTGEPAAFMAGRAVRVEAGWPADLAESDICLHALGQRPAGGGRWLVGRTERGNVLTAGLSDQTPHWLLSGATGSGKSTALVSTVAQLAQDRDNRLILVDAKHGASLRRVAHVRGRVGPLACDVMTARAALGWACREMTARYSGGQDTRRLVIVIDEVQDLVSDSVAAESLRRLVVQGRGAKVFCIVATQHPVILPTVTTFHFQRSGS
jgi:hypothetical protein